MLRSLQKSVSLAISSYLEKGIRYIEFLRSGDRLQSTLRRLFERTTARFTRDCRDGLRVVARTIFQHRTLLIALFFFNLLAAVFEGGTMGILVLAVSVLIENQSVDDLSARFVEVGSFVSGVLPNLTPAALFIMLILLAVLAQLLKSLMTFLGRYFAIQLQIQVNIDLQEKSTEHVMAYSYAEVTKVPAGTLGSLVGQTSHVAGLVSTINRGVLSVVMFITYLTTMILLSVPLALTAMAIIACMWIAISGTIKLLRALGERTIRADMHTSKVQTEYFQAPRLLRIFSATTYAAREINAARAVGLRAVEKGMKIKAIVDPSLDALTIISAGLFLVGGYYASGESASNVIPKLLLFLLVLNRMMPQAKALNDVRMNVASTIEAIGIIGAFLRTEDKEYERSGGIRSNGLRDSIQFSDVSFRYSGTTAETLSDLNFSIHRGQTVALVGGSGAGKSTIANLLLGLFSAQHGAILVDGVNLREMDISDWRKIIGMVDQEVFLLNGSVKDNISFAADNLTMEDVERAAKLAHAHEFIIDLPHSYDAMIGDRGLRLSGGQQQRLALARALVRAPEVLILDEATSSLDSESERLIQKTLEELHASMTILVIAHRLSTIAKADQILVLESGRIVERGRFQDLVQAGGRFATLWRLQVNSS